MSKLIETATAIATELGEDWSAEPMHEYGATLTDGDVSLFVRVGTYGTEAGRLLFSPSYPPGARDVVRYDEHPHTSTTAAHDREPRAIARQLERTVIPDAREWFPIIRERLQGHADAETARRAVLARIAAIVPDTRDNGGDATSARLYTSGPWYGDVRIGHDGTTGSLDLHSIPMDVLLSILELLPTEAPVKM